MMLLVPLPRRTIPSNRIRIHVSIRAAIVVVNSKLQLLVLVAVFGCEYRLRGEEMAEHNGGENYDTACSGDVERCCCHKEIFRMSIVLKLSNPI